MTADRLVTVSARVSQRTRELAVTAAKLRATTLSGFIAIAVEEAARRELFEKRDRRKPTAATASPRRSA